ncbi:hypothetical protein LDENG_00180600 [Lucifuga dentata]|nr:hypothetical protein LDENG_00180600 [Lucifuga dentata]
MLWEMIISNVTCMKIEYIRHKHAKWVVWSFKVPLICPAFLFILLFHFHFYFHFFHLFPNIHLSFQNQIVELMKLLGLMVKYCMMTQEV